MNCLMECGSRYFIQTNRGHKRKRQLIYLKLRRQCGLHSCGGSFKLKIEQGTEVGVERENFRAHPSGVQNNEVQSLCINEPTLKIVPVVRWSQGEVIFAGRESCFQIKISGINHFTEWNKLKSFLSPALSKVDYGPRGTAILNYDWLIPSSCRKIMHSTRVQIQKEMNNFSFRITVFPIWLWWLIFIIDPLTWR